MTLTRRTNKIVSGFSHFLMAHGMAKTLISWLGRTDLQARTQSDRVGLGPIAQAVGARGYARLELLCDYPQEEAEPYMGWLRAQHILEITPHYVTLTRTSVPVQRCTVHKERNLLAHAPQRLHEEIKKDYNDMMYAPSMKEALAKRKAFIAKWRLKCRGVADSLEEAGERLFTFLRYPPEQWKSLRTTNSIEHLHEEFKRRIKTQCVLPSSATASMLFWALMASGQIIMHRVNGCNTLNQKPNDEPWVALAA